MKCSATFIAELVDQHYTNKARRHWKLVKICFIWLRSKQFFHTCCMQNWDSTWLQSHCNRVCSVCMKNSKMVHVASLISYFDLKNRDTNERQHRHFRGEQFDADRSPPAFLCWSKDLSLVWTTSFSPPFSPSAFLKDVPNKTESKVVRRNDRPSYFFRNAICTTCLTTVSALCVFTLCRTCVCVSVRVWCSGLAVL